MITCEAGVKSIKDGAKLAEEKFKIDAELKVDALVGFASKKEIANAKPSEKKKLLMLNLLNSSLHSDIVRVGRAQGFPEDAIVDQLDGWANYMYRFAGGTKVTPDVIKLGPKRTYSVMKAVNKAIKQRDMNIKRADRTKRTSLRERAFSRPDVFMSLWDRSGVGQKLVRKAMGLGENIQQTLHRFYGAVGEDNDRVKLELRKLIDNRVPERDSSGKKNKNAGEPILTLKNAGVGYMTYHSNNEDLKISDEEPSQKPILIKDFRIVNDEPEYLIKLKGTEGDWTWENQSVVPLSIDDYETELIELISDQYTDELANGQVRNVDFIKITSDKLQHFLGTKEGKNVRKLMTKDYARNNITIGGKTYQFVMVKQGESKPGETEHIPEFYNAYIVNGEGVDFFNNAHDNLGDISKKNGYYKSNAFMSFKEKGKFIPQFNKFIRQRIQPNKLIVGSSEDSNVNIWENIGKKRVATKAFFRWKRERGREVEEKMQKMYSKLVKKHGVEIAQEKFEDLVRSGNVKSRAYFDGDKLRTGNYGFGDVAVNYMPRNWRQEDLDDMMIKEIGNIEAKLAILSNDKVKNKTEILLLEDQLKHFKIILDFDFENPEGDKDEVNRVILSRIIVGNKKRQLWTDVLRRRKDGAVLQDAFNNDIQVILNNDIVAEMMGVVDKMINYGSSEDVISYVTNKVKQTIGDANTRGIDKSTDTLGSYIWLAEKMNRYIPERIKRGRIFDAESARKLVMHIGGFNTMRFLGMSGALGNNTQIINPFIRYGYTILRDAMKLVDSKDPMTKKRIDNVMGRLGVENVLTMMENFMTKDVEITGMDFFLYPGTIVPSGNAINWAKLVKLSTKDFANSKGKEFDKIDKLLKQIQQKYPGNKDKDVVYMRTMLHKLLTMDKKDSQKVKLVEKRLKALFGTMAENRFRAMVTWKLSWWFNNAPGKEYFTFTEGEKRMRRITALAAIIDANKKGSLPGDIKRDDIWETDAAVEIGRKAVFAQMFGMSTPYMGEAFDGFYRLLFQYKTYPLQQAQFEYDVMRSFIYGNEDPMQGVARLFETQMKIMSDVAKKAAGKKIKGYSPNNKDIDYEAVQMLRLIYTRFFISGLSTFMSLIPFLGMAMRRIGPFASSFNMVRNGESPAFSIALKTVLWGVLMSMGFSADDDDKYGRALKNSQRGMLMMTTPAILGAISRDVSGTTDWLKAISDNPTPANYINNPLVNT